MYTKKKWLPIALIIYFIQIALEGLALIQIYRMNMLPDTVVMVITLIIILMTIITGMMLLKGMWKKPSVIRRIRRIAAIVLAVVMAGGSVLMTHMAARLDQTVDTITADESETQKITAFVGVYVMSDNAAESINDLTSENFGVMENFDQSNTEYAVNYIDQQTGATITTSAYPSMVELAQALYDGETNAIILNEAFAGALTEFDQFTQFTTETKEVLEIPITVEDSSSDNNNDVIDASASSEEKMEAITAAASDSDITSTPFIIYLSGSDTREEMLVTSRSDVNLLMVVNPTTKQILLLNTPRDYYVENPAGDYAYDKLTHCGIYGIDNSEKALENLYDINIDYFMQINFTGFENLVDAIGGITVYSPVAFSANDIGGDGYDFVEGENELDGDEALMFARERHAFASGDNARGENQMRVITAILDKLTSDGTTLLLNYDKIMDSIEGMFMTDLTDGDIAALVKMQLTEQSEWNIKSYAVSGEGGSEYTYSAPNSLAYVMYQDESMVDHASELVQKVLDGETLTDEDVEDTESVSSSSTSEDSSTSASEDTSYSTDSTYNSYDSSGYSSTGYDSSGYTDSGYSDSGYDSSGYYDTSGYDSSGYDSAGYDSSGYNSTGYDSSTGTYY